MQNGCREKRESLLLLQKWGDENTQAKLLSCTRKKPIWQEISAFLRAAGYEDRDEDACKTRIHTLISAYRAYKDECWKTGNAAPKKPAFFDEVDEYLSGKPCTKPKSVVNSSQIVIGDDTEDCAEESKGNAENVVPNLTSTSSSSSSNSSNNSNNYKASKCPEPKKDACVTCTGELSKKTIAYWRARRCVTKHGRLALSTKS